jgi:endogenous inhibitor of DNA gyrase (YacG/DUF329 family)
MTHYSKPNHDGQTYKVSTHDTFNCLQCGNSSEPAKRPKIGVKYCSRQCNGAAKVVPKKYRDCEHCGTTFELSIKHPDRRFCTHKCASLGLTDTNKKIEKECPICKNLFSVYKSCITERTPRDYCSNKCRHVGKATNAGSTITESGGIINSSGYVRITLPSSTERVYEHRYVMEQHLQRPLRDKENVHHINGIRHDNRLENLELWTSSQPSGQRVSELLEWAEDILITYKDDIHLL